MNLSILQKELATRQKKFRLGRFESDINAAVLGNNPIRATGTDSQCRTVSVIIPTKLEVAERDMHALHFIPVWSRTYVVADVWSRAITNIYCRFDFGKFAFCKDGEREVNFTDCGGGVDPTVLIKAETTLGELINKDKSGAPVAAVIKFLQERYKEGKLK